MKDPPVSNNVCSGESLHVEITTCSQEESKHCGSIFTGVIVYKQLTVSIYRGEIFTEVIMYKIGQY